MRITAPRTQDERLVPLLDTPPKWLPGIDVGIQTHFLLKFVFVFFNWNILLIFLSSAFKFLLKGLVSAALCFLAGFLLFWGGQRCCSDAVWSGSYVIHSNHLDGTRLVVYVLYPLSPLYHTTRVRTEPDPAPYYEMVEDELPPPFLFLT